MLLLCVYVAIVYCFMVWFALRVCRLVVYLVLFCCNAVSEVGDSFVQLVCFDAVKVLHWLLGLL